MCVTLKMLNIRVISVTIPSAAHLQSDERASIVSRTSVTVRGCGTDHPAGDVAGAVQAPSGALSVGPGGIYFDDLRLCSLLELLCC